MDGTAFRGISPALVTPMTAAGDVDLVAFTAHVEWMLEGGVHGLVPCGTTGESATLDADEQFALIRRTVEVAAGRVPVIAGAGGNDTRVVAALARRAREAGADAVLTVTPPYNKPTPDGLVAHYRAVSDAAGIPVLLYNVPGRTAQNVPPELVMRIAREVPGVVGVKESAGRIEQLTALTSARPDGFVVLSGDDDLALPALAAGADGVISVAANEIPADLVALFDEVAAGHLAAARTRFFRILPLLQTNFVETNPIPVKTALELMGRAPAHFRLPLVPMTAAHRARLADALRAAGVAL